MQKVISNTIAEDTIKIKLVFKLWADEARVTTVSFCNSISIDGHFKSHHISPIVEISRLLIPILKTLFRNQSLIYQ
jgi:hypothetical protein